MRLSPDVASALIGISHILRFDRNGFKFFDRSPAGAWRSFMALFLVFPIFALQLFTIVTMIDGSPPLARFLAVKILMYVISWFAYPVALWYLSAAINRRQFFVSYLAPYNWFQFAISLAALPILVLSLSGAMTGDFGLLIFLVYQIAIFAYLTFIAMVGLNLPMITAVMIAVFDLVMSELINAIGTLLSGLQLAAS